MALELEHVTKRFGKFTAVDDLSLSIPESEMFGFLGRMEPVKRLLSV